MSLKFEDLSAFDIDLIRDTALKLMLDTNGFNRINCLIDATISCIYAKGYTINVPNLDCLFKITDTKQSSTEIIQTLFNILETQVAIIKDINKTPTWSVLRPSLFIRPTTYKKTWMI